MVLRLFLVGVVASLALDLPRGPDSQSPRSDRSRAEAVASRSVPDTSATFASILEMGRAEAAEPTSPPVVVAMAETPAPAAPSIEADAPALAGDRAEGDLAVVPEHCAATREHRRRRGDLRPDDLVVDLFESHPRHLSAGCTRTVPAPSKRTGRIQ